MKKTKVLGQNFVTVLLCVPQISHGLYSGGYEGGKTERILKEVVMS